MDRYFIDMFDADDRTSEYEYVEVSQWAINAYLHKVGLNFNGQVYILAVL